LGTTGTLYERGGEKAILRSKKSKTRNGSGMKRGSLGDYRRAGRTRERVIKRVPSSKAVEKIGKYFSQGDGLGSNEDKVGEGRVFKERSPVRKMRRTERRRKPIQTIGREEKWCKSSTVIKSSRVNTDIWTQGIEGKKETVGQPSADGEIKEV